MAAGDASDFRTELRARAPEIVEELLGAPTFRSRREWRWGRRGSLAVVVSGEKAGQWYDHEAGSGGGLVDLIAREHRTDRSTALAWTTERIGRPRPSRPPRARPAPPPAPAETPVTDRAAEARRRAAAIWNHAAPAPSDHPYLARKWVPPYGIRCDMAGRLIVPLRDGDGVLHTIETIAADGSKRYLAGGAKAGHFCPIGPAPDPDGLLLICEGWATGASLHQATGLPVVAAMDAGNLMPVAERLRRAFPDAAVTLVADNDAKPGRDDNPGVQSATRTAEAIGARLAVPPEPGDANDLTIAHGLAAVATMVERAAPVAPPEPTYPAPTLGPEEARAALASALDRFMAEVRAYWSAVDAAAEAEPAAPGIDLDPPPAAAPPLLGLPVDVGLGKSTTARAAIAALLVSGALGQRKVVYAVPRHDLGREQVEALTALGVPAMLWKGRTAPDPAPDDPERLMCRDPDAVFDALEVEQAVEQSCCRVSRGGALHLCPHYRVCGYQRQKPEARAARVIVCAHESLFHMKPTAVGTVGLLVIDEAFWQSGLRGLDGKATLTRDGLEPGRASITCYQPNGRIDTPGTADLVVARERLWRALQASEPGPLRHDLLTGVGLTARDCRDAAALERRRLRDPGLLPGMGPSERRRRIGRVLPPYGQPWAPPGRCAALWRILAAALDDGHDAAGAVLVDEPGENGTVRSLRLRWRDPLRKGWAAQIPVLHLDATLQSELVRPYLSGLAFHGPVAAVTPHVRVRQVLGSPTTGKALTPAAHTPEREHRAARHHARDLIAYVALRAREHRGAGGRADVLLIGQKAAVDTLRDAGLPPRVDTAHLNGLSGLDRWGDVACLIVLGRTLPAPATVETLAVALTGRPPATAADAGWWYDREERRLRLADGSTRARACETHPDPTAEAIRWSICEAELIQAIGRGRGVNRTAATPLQIDLLTDVVLPVTVDELLPWADLAPARRDLMAARGVVLTNAADMSTCFPDLWPTADAARQDRRRSVTNGYYRSLYNSEMSHSSAGVRYRPEGAGHRPRRALFDLALIRDPETWLTRRLGPLAACEVERAPAAPPDGWGAARRADYRDHPCSDPSPSPEPGV